MADRVRPAGRTTVRKLLVFGSKLVVTCLCFWYVFRQIKIVDLLNEAGTLNWRWLVIAVGFIVVQIRWLAYVGPALPTRSSRSCSGVRGLR